MPNAGVCSPAGVCWISPNPTGVQLTTVQAFAPDDVWVAGASGTVLHFDGEQWSGRTEVIDGSFASLWGSSSADLWLLANINLGFDPTDAGVVLRGDGGSWIAFSAGHPPLAAVHGSAADSVYVVGDRTLLLFDGGSFGRPFSSTSSDITEWTDVHAVSDGELWLTGSNGEVKHVYHSSPQYGIGVAWGNITPLAPDAVWVFSEAGNAMFFDGGSLKPAPAPPSQGTAVWAAGSEGMWAFNYFGEVHRWDGSEWQLEWDFAHDDTVWMRATHGTSAQDVWSVGDEGRIFHRNATGWSNVTEGTALYDGGSGFSESLAFSRSYGAVWAAGDDDVWVGGNGFEMLRLRGDTMSHVPMASKGVVEAMFGFAPNDIWGGGYGGLQRWDGTAWRLIAPAFYDYTFGLWGSAPDDVWAVGFRGTIKRWNGTAWRHVGSGYTQWDYQAVWGSGPSDVWIGGGSGKLLRWRGGPSFEEVPTGTTSGISSILGFAPDDVWFAAGSELLHWTGSAFERHPGGVSRLVGTSAADLHGLGSNSIHRWTGSTWDRVKTGAETAKPLKAIARTPNGTLWVAGEGATLLRKAP